MDITGLTRRTILATGLAGLAGAAFPFRRALAAYPEHPITWIVAYAAGGGSDTLARIRGGALSPRGGGAIVIETRRGGEKNSGAPAAARADPEAPPLFTADNGTLVFNPA